LFGSNPTTSGDTSQFILERWRIISMTKSGASSEQPLIDARAWLADTSGL